MAITGNDAIPVQAERTRVTKLSRLERWLYGLLYMLSDRDGKAWLAKRKAYTVKFDAMRHEYKLLRAKLNREAVLYASIISDAWTGLGYGHIRNFDGSINPEDKRIARVKFSRIITSAEVIYFEIMVYRRGLFGSTYALPHRVRVADLINDDTITQLTFATRRKITVRTDAPQSGIWIKLHRNEASDDLPAMVAYRDTVDLLPESHGAGPLCIGVAANRKAVILNLEDIHHIMVAGSTGAGKSNIVNVLITTLISTHSPSELQLILVDLKELEFTHFDSLPHLARPVITDIEEAVTALDLIEVEFSRRKRLLASKKAKNLTAYNKAHPDHALPRIVVVIDEFAEFTMAGSTRDRDSAKKSVVRMINLGRALGINLIVCTQRPSKSVMPMELRGQVCTIGGRTGDDVTSTVIFGTSELARLPPVAGRMMYKLGSIRQEIQTPLIDDKDIEIAVKAAQKAYPHKVEVNQTPDQYDDDPVYLLPAYVAHSVPAARARAKHPVELFVDECCITGEALEVLSSDLQTAYEAWRKHNGHEKLAPNKFGAELNKLGFGRRGGKSNVTIRTGLALKPS
jgi:energy-coupling factor transporter ATP-binding protein EcfA2